MKIKVKMSVSESTQSDSFTLDELGFMKEEWENLSDIEKIDAIQKAVDDLPEHPYWVVDSFTDND